MSLQQRLLLGLLPLVWLASCPAAEADQPGPLSSYKVVTPDGKYVFVMITPVPPTENARFWTESMVQADQEIRRTYPRSGLYPNDGSATPMWTVDWYARRVEVASDGVHLIRHGPWAESTDEEAVSFFANGELLRTYQIKDLVDEPGRLPHTWTHFQWCKEAQFDDGRLEYAVSTFDGNRFIFDVRSGAIISRSVTAEVLRRLVAVAAVLAVPVIALAWYFARRRAKAATAGPT
jgi:hypothetical protein